MLDGTGRERTFVGVTRPALLTIVAMLSLACASDPDGKSPSLNAGGGAAPTGGSASGGQQASAGNPTAGSNSSGGNASGGASPMGGAAGASGSASGFQPSAGSNAGGSAGVGGSGGAGGGSAGAGGALTGCMGVTAKFCDDFEAQTTGASPKGDFTVNAKPGAMVVDTSKAYSGTKALHITSAKPGSTAFLEFTKQFPLNDFHGRAMFYLTRIPTAEIHWDLIDTVSQNSVHWEIGGMYGKFILVVDPPDHGLTSNPFPTGKWFCLQWQFKYGGAGVDNTFLAQMDGTALDKGKFTGADAQGQKWNAGVWKTLSIGWTGYGSSDIDLEEWIDDLALGDQPIPCPVAK